jgi:polynucleotide 5'-hydroxyl-kinase GRC3/NOL9
VVLIVGAAEAGKSTFAAWLANALHARGLTVALVDADVGQSEIGPPATVGFGRVRRPLTRTGDAEPLGFEFVGVTSPGRRPWRIVEAAGRASARARARFDRVIVDTSGFIAGGFARAVKQRKIAAVDPDVVVAIQVADEAEHIVRHLAGRARPRVLRLPAIRGMRPRSPAARRRHRDAALARHLEGAGPVALALVRVAVHSISGEPLSPENIAVGAIAALHASNGETLALGVVDAVDVVRRTLTVRTTRTADEIAAVTVGETTVT